ncbi:hypothetical protein [Sodalis praecaptivus]|uniref:hypothetical protein n=1 Tax=Sodalis praecaptivus TaxID=1239307 RepID=UPI0031FA0A27
MVHSHLAGLNGRHKHIKRDFTKVNTAAISSHGINDEGGRRRLCGIEEKLWAKVQAMLNGVIDV